MTISSHTSRPTPRLSPAAVVALLGLFTVAVTWVLAHEGHAPLPSKGIQVDVAKGQMILSPEARSALDVQTAEVTAEPVEERFLAYATVVTPWQQHAYATTRIAGSISALHVRPGETVQAGQPLAVVKSLELENLQLDFLNAHNDIELSAKTIAILEPSVRRGAVREQALIEAQTKQRQQQNAFEVARSKLLSLGFTAADLDTILKGGKTEIVQTLPIVSPVGGTVIHADLTVGKVVTPDEHLYEIVDLSTVWVQIGVLERDLHRVTVGQRVELTLSAYPGEEAFPTHVKVISASLDPQTHLGTVWAELRNPTDKEPRFLPGMTGQAQIVLAGPSAKQTIPAAAVFSEGAERYVLVEEASASNSMQLVRRNVVLGRQSGERVEVFGGDLFPGTRVVTRGGHELAGVFVPGVLRLSKEAARNIGLKLEPAKPRSLEDVIEVNGTVDVPADRRANASAQLSGKLQRILVDRAATVRAGQVLAEVASLELQDLQMEMLRSHLETQLLEETLQRLRGVAGVVPQPQILEAESKVNASRNRRDSFKRKLVAAGLTPAQVDKVLADKKLIDVLPVVAPLDGVVVQFDKMLGQVIKAEEPLFAIHDVSQSLVQGHVSERDLARVRVGQSVRVRLVAAPEPPLDGKVVRSGRIFGVEDRTLTVWVELAGSSTIPLRHGQLATLMLVAGQSRPTLTVPLSAVVTEGTRSFVFVANADGVFERRLIQIGRVDDRYAEVRGGLEEKELVAVGGTAGLQTAYSGLR